MKYISTDVFVHVIAHTNHTESNFTLVMRDNQQEWMTLDSSKEHGYTTYM